jgi:predicted Fe-Mo cluster-binding NifX family protein
MSQIDTLSHEYTQINERHTMKIAVSAQEGKPDSLVDPRFGRAKYFIVHDVESGSWDALDNNQNLQAAQGAGIQSASTVVNAGCTALISGHCGPKAFTALNKAGVAVYAVTGGTVRQAVDTFKRGELNKLEVADVDGHW